jgi:CubicO group peptidase (beta-lactamase class C family)
VKHALDDLLQRGVEENIYALARAEVWYEGQHVFSGGNAPPQTLFDLASVTKVMSTTALVLDRGLDLSAPVRTWLPTAVDATIDDLLFHRSGLPPFQPYFADELTQHPALFDADCALAVRTSARARVIERVAATRPEAAPGTRCAYSDLGFILLGAALEAHSGAPLDRLFERHIAQPLGLKNTGYRRLSARLSLPSTLADTGATRPREPAPGQEGLWSVPERPTRRAEVDDDNAWVMDGVSGHAGLFGTAADVASFGLAVLSGPWRPLAAVRDLRTRGSTRARGFDTPALDGASCGPRFGRAGPRGAIGHLGFTGTSLWIDLDRSLVVALLTNRVVLGRHNVRIREFRPRFHDAVLDALGLK